MNTQLINKDWKILMRFLPNGWKECAYELGALKRRKKIDSAETLLRLLLIHFADGKSLRTTAAYANEVGICDINDVALLHRLRVSEDWLHWIVMELQKDLKVPLLSEPINKKYRIRLVDGTSVSEQGSTGSDWRIHYSFRLDNLRCDFFEITDTKVGESFEQYPVEEEDLVIGDRGYCKRKGIIHVLENGGDVMVRFHSTNLPLYTRKGKTYDVLENLRTLSDGKAGDWDVWFKNHEGGELLKGRLCSIRKSPEAIKLAKKQAIRNASKKGHNLRPETLEYAEYITIFTTVNRHNYNGENILTLYRGRWQIELVFKRLKSIVGIGCLPKYNLESCKAWLYGKMLVALLTERLYQEAEFFSPWGYPLSSPQ